MLRRHRWLAAVLVAVLGAGAACSGSGGSEDAGTPEAKSAQGEKKEPTESEPVPAVVAEVNGEKIGKAEFMRAYQAQAPQPGQPAQPGQPSEEQLRDQVVQSLVTQTLLMQEADKRKIDASDGQVDRTLDELAQQNGMKDGTQLVEALKQRGMKAGEIRAQAAMQTRLDQLIAQEAGNVQASDQEVRALYAQLKAQSQAGGQQGGQSQQVPPLTQVRPQLEQQIESQQESQAARGLVDELRKGADITIHV